jgi:hypothetical protein
MPARKKDTDQILLNKDEAATFHLLGSRRLSLKAKRRCIRGGGITKRTVDLCRRKVRALVQNKHTPKAVLTKLRTFKDFIDEFGDDANNHDHQERLNLLGTKVGVAFSQKLLPFIVNYDMDAGTRAEPVSKRYGGAAPEFAAVPHTPEGIHCR